MSANGVVGSRVPRDRMETTEGRACRPATAVPSLRFKGFDGAWEETRFSQFATLRRGLTYSPLDCAKEGVRVLRSSNIDDDKFVLRSDDVFVDHAAANIAPVKNGDILITAANGSSHLVGKHAVVAGVEECSAVHGGFMLLASSNESSFLNAAMSAPWYRDFIATAMMGGNGALGNLNQDLLEEVSFAAPSAKKERDQLGTSFRQIDALIAAREAALGKLTNLKKAMLEKMFPRAGAKVPEVRFKGFEGEWEEKQLIGLVRKRSESAVSRGCPKVEYEDILSFEGRLLRDVKDLFVEKRGITFYANDVLFGKLRPYLGNWFHANFQGVAVGDWWVLKPINIDSSFLYVMIQSERFQWATNQAAGSKMPRADWHLVSELEYFIPRTRDEQRKIGAYFRSLDSLIAARREEVGKLKDLKKALLDRMFV